MYQISLYVANQFEEKLNDGQVILSSTWLYISCKYTQWAEVLRERRILYKVDNVLF